MARGTCQSERHRNKLSMQASSDLCIGSAMYKAIRSRMMLHQFSRQYDSTGGADWSDMKILLYGNGNLWLSWNMLYVVGTSRPFIYNGIYFRDTKNDIKYQNFCAGQRTFKKKKKGNRYLGNHNNMDWSLRGPQLPKVPRISDMAISPRACPWACVTPEA